MLVALQSKRKSRPGLLPLLHHLLPLTPQVAISSCSSFPPGIISYKLLTVVISIVSNIPNYSDLFSLIITIEPAIVEGQGYITVTRAGY